MLGQTGLAQHFGVSVMTLFRWRRDVPDFPKSVTICGRHYWSVEAVERWKSERATDSRPPQPKSKGARADQERIQADRKRKNAEIRAAKHALAAAQQRLEAARQKTGRKRKPAVRFVAARDASEVA
jgi:hypothetical protein